MKRSDLPHDERQHEHLQRQVEGSRFYVKIRWTKLVPNPIFDVVCSQCGASLIRLLRSDPVERIEFANHQHECPVIKWEQS